jgi:hypothetical protein
MYNSRLDSIGRFRTSNFYIHARQQDARVADSSVLKNLPERTRKEWCSSLRLYISSDILYPGRENSLAIRLVEYHAEDFRFKYCSRIGAIIAQAFSSSDSISITSDQGNTR